MKGDGNQYDYGFRIYDPRVGRFYSIDPLQEKYPQLTPYQFASNTPIQAVDLDGREEFHYTMVMGKQGQAVLIPTKTVKLEGRGNKNLRRYVVEYEDPVSNSCKTYHIGFPLYGTGFANGMKADDFENNYLKKQGNYIAFGFIYVDDEHSTAGSNAAIVVNAQNSVLENTIPGAEEETPNHITNKKVASAHAGNPETFVVSDETHLEIIKPRGITEDANFAQKTFSGQFSEDGAFAGRTVDDVALSLKNGTLSVNSVPIEYIMRDGQQLILNTRSAAALTKAGIPRSKWLGVNVTGDAAAQKRLTSQLKTNKLTNIGSSTTRQSGTNIVVGSNGVQQ